jgi:hypothetical protein
VADRAQVQVDRLEAAEVAFHVGQPLVGGDHAGGVQLAGGDAGAEYVDAVQGSFGVDRALVAGVGDVVVGDLQGEVLGHLELAEHPAHPHADLPGLDQPAGLDLPGDLGQLGFGRCQQRVAFAGPLRGQRGVAAGHQPLPRKVGVGDLGQVHLVEQAELQRAALRQRLHRGGAQAGTLQVSQPAPPSSRSASIRAAVIMR